MNLIFVTGNANKARLFSELVGQSIDHKGVEVDEIQSLDLVEVATKKAIVAYERMQQPVIVEDTGVIINALGKLPGPFIRWFIEELGLEELCRLADRDSRRLATAQDVFVYYDGIKTKHFLGSLDGTISDHPKGDNGWDWDKIFIPYDNNKTMGEMDDQEYTRNHLRIKPMNKLKEFLSGLDSQ